MNISEIAKGLTEGKCYQLPEWWRFYIFASDNNIYIKSPYTIPQEYSMKVTEMNDVNWVEVTEEQLKNIKD